MQVSGMSQSLTESLHVAPLSSYWQRKTAEEDEEQREAREDGNESNKQFKWHRALKQLTLQSLQQSPLLHIALCVRVHFLQQLAPLLAHSCRSERVYWTCVDYEYKGASGPRAGGKKRCGKWKIPAIQHDTAVQS